MNHDQLQNWADRAAQELQEYIDAAQEAGSDEPATQALLDEYHRLQQGLPTWQTQILQRELTSEMISED